jgi:hypothetical protein
MSAWTKPDRGSLAAHCHEVTVSLEGRQVAEFDLLVLIGMAVHLAINLRGVPAVSYELLRQIALHLLHIPPTSLPLVVEILGEAEFAQIDKCGSTIRSIVPTVPYFEDLFDTIGEIVEDRRLSEHEQMTIELVSRLRRSPVVSETLYQDTGARKEFVDRVVDLGAEGGYLIKRRARGRNVVLSPLYFPDNPEAFADLVAAAGSNPVGRVLSLLKENQGWPLTVIEQQQSIGANKLTPHEVAIVTTLAQEGFAPPPTITTSHAGSNHFLFGPRPGPTKLPPTKRPIYEAAMALVAAVRQGQLLPRAHRIRSPRALLRALRDRKWLNANTEAVEQYRELVVTFGLGRLVPTRGSFYRFELIDTPDNMQALEMAIRLVDGSDQTPVQDGDVTLAFHGGQAYLDSLIGRRRLVAEKKATIDEGARREIDGLLLRRAK